MGILFRGISLTGSVISVSIGRVAGFWKGPVCRSGPLTFTFTRRTLKLGECPSCVNT